MPDTPLKPLVLPTPTRNNFLSDIVPNPNAPLSSTGSVATDLVSKYIAETQQKAFIALANEPIKTPMSQARRYDDPFWGFNPARYDQEDLYARNQSVWGSLANGVGRLLSTTLTKTGSGLGFIFGGMVNAFDSDATSSFSKWVSESSDNAFSNFFSKLEEDIKEDWLPIYQEASDRNKGFWRRAATDLNFWTEDFVDGAAFMASTLIPGMALSKVGTGVKLLNALSRMSKLEPGLEAAAIRAAIQGGRQLSKYEATLMLPKVAKWINNAKLARSIDVGATSVLSTAAEAMFEANETKHQVIESLTGKINPETNLPYTEQEILQRAALAARDTYIGNLAALSLSNLWEANLLFKKLPSTSSIGGTASVELGEGLLSAANIVKPNYLKEFGKNTAKGIAVEGFWEENMQLAISRFNQSKVDPTNLETRKYSNSVIDNYINQTIGAITGEDKEAALSIGLGGILGGILGGTLSTREDRRKDKELEGRVIQYNNLVSSFKNLDIYEKQEIEIIDNEGNKTKKTTIRRDINGNPILNRKGINKFIEGNIERARILEMIDKAEQSGDQSLVSLLENELLSQLSLAYFQMGKADSLYERLTNLQNIKDQDLSFLGLDPQSKTTGLAKLPNIVSKVKKLENLYNDIQQNVVSTNDPVLDEERRKKLYELGSRQIFLLEELKNTENRAARYETYNPTLETLNKLVANEKAATERRRGLELLVDDELVSTDKTSTELIEEADKLLEEAKKQKEEFINQYGESIKSSFKQDEDGFYSQESDITGNILQNKLKNEELLKAGAIRLSLVETVNRFNRIADPTKGAKYFKNFINQPVNLDEYDKLDKYEVLQSFSEDREDLNDKLRVIAEHKRYDELTTAIPQLLDELLPLSERLKKLELSRSPLAKELLNAYKKEIEEFKARMEEKLKNYKERKEAEKFFLQNKELLDKLDREQAELDKETLQNPVIDNTVTEINFYSSGKKKALEILFRSTEAMDEWDEKGTDHGKRQNRFLFNLKRGKPAFANRKFKTILVTVNNEESIQLNGFINNHLRGADIPIAVEDPSVSPYIAIFVEQLPDGSLFYIDQEGNQLGKVGESFSDFNSLVYGVLPTSNLRWSSTYDNELRYQHVKRGGETVPDEVAKEESRKWEISRRKILELKTVPIYGFGVSNGHPEFDFESIIDENDRRKERKNNPVVGSLVDQSDLNYPLIEIPTTDTLTVGDLTIDAPNGRPFILEKGGLGYHFLKNRLLSKDKAELVFKLLKELSKRKTLGRNPITDFLQHIIFFGSPREGTPISYSQVWVSQGKLHIGRHYSFTFDPLSLEAEKERIITILQNEVYANIKKSSLDSANFSNPFDEITDIDEDGNIKVIRWKSYQHYLLSPVYVTDEADTNDLNGKQREDEIPLTTSIRLLENEDDVNLRGIYAILPNSLLTDYISPEEAQSQISQATSTSSALSSQKIKTPEQVFYEQEGYVMQAERVAGLPVNFYYRKSDGAIVISKDESYNKLIEKYITNEDFINAIKTAIENEQLPEGTDPAMIAEAHIVRTLQEIINKPKTETALIEDKKEEKNEVEETKAPSEIVQVVVNPIDPISEELQKITKEAEEKINELEKEKKEIEEEIEKIEKSRQSEAPKEKTKEELANERQEKINRLLDRIDRFKKLRKNATNRSLELNEIRLQASELGLTFNDRSEKLLNKKGKQVRRKNLITGSSIAENFSPDNYSDQTKKYINLVFNHKDGIDALRFLDIPGYEGRALSKKQIEAAIKAHNDGNFTLNVKSIYDFIESSNGFFDIEDKVTGRGERVSIQDYFSVLEEAPLSEQELEQIERQKWIEQTEPEEITEEQTFSEEEQNKAVEEALSTILTKESTVLTSEEKQIVEEVATENKEEGQTIESFIREQLSNPEKELKGDKKKISVFKRILQKISKFFAVVAILWISANPIADFLGRTGIVSREKTQFVMDLTKAPGSITERSFNSDEKNIILTTIKNAESKGRSYVTYADYPTKNQGVTTNTKKGQDKDNENIIFSSPELVIKRTLGQFVFKKSPDGKYNIADQYNFNNAGETQDKSKIQYIIEGFADQTLSTYAKIRRIATAFGSSEGSGSIVSIKLEDKEPSSSKRFVLFGLPLLALIRRKREENEPITDDDLNGLKDRLTEIDNQIAQIKKNLEDRVKELNTKKTENVLENIPSNQPEEKIIPVSESQPEEKLKPEDEEKARELLKKARTRRNRPNSEYRRIVGEIENVQKENWEKLEKWRKKNLPNVPLYRLKNIIAATGGGFAWGEFTSAGMFVYENAEIGTGYHEAFEAVWNVFTSKYERSKLLAEFRERQGSYYDATQGKIVEYKAATDSEAKEKIAEEFRELKLTGKKPIRVKKNQNFILQFFTDLLNFLESLIFGVSKDINHLFEKIDSGYYKNRVFDTGALDMRTPAYSRVKGLHTLTEKEIIEGISQKLVQDMYENNRSLSEFDESLIDVDTHYKNVFDKLRDEFEVYKQDDFDDEIERIEKDDTKDQSEKEYLKQILTTYREKELQIWNTIQQNWKKLIELNNQYLTLYRIGIKKLDSNEEGDLPINKSSEENENKNMREYEQNYFKYDGKKNAPASVKLLIATISESFFDEDGKLREKMSPLGFPQKVDYIKTFNLLSQELKDVNTLEEKKQKLAELGKQFPNIQRLYNRLFRPDPSIDDYKLMIKWFTVFSLQRPDPLIMYVNEDGSTYIGSANLSNEIDNTIKSWIDALKLKASNEESSAIKVLGNGTYYFNIDLLKEIQIRTVEDKIEFLKLLGIEFSKSDYDNFDSAEKRLFSDSISSIKNTLTKNQILLANNSRSLTIEGSLRNIAQLHVSSTYTNFDSTYFNIEGERVQVNIFNNFFSSTINDINNSKDLKDLFKRVTYLKIDPLTENSVWLKKFFDENGQRNPLQKIRLKYIQGIIDQNKTRSNVPTEKLQFPERVIQEFNINLTGAYYVLVPADSKTEWLIDVDHDIKLSEFHLPSVWNKITNIFWGYYETEVKNKKLGLSKDIIGEENLTLSKVEFEKKLRTFVDNIKKDYIEFFKENGIAVDQGDGTFKVNKILTDFLNNNFDGNILNESQLEQLIYFRTVNYMIANSEMMKLFFGDINQYKDPLKRFKSFLSPREISMHSSPEIDKVLDNKYNEVKGIKLNNKVPGYTSYKDYLSTVAAEDVTSVSPLIKFIDELDISKKEKDELKKQYSKVNEVDGQSLITLPQYRQIMQKAGSRWSKDHETLYQYLMAKDRLNMEKDGFFNYENAGVADLRKIDIEILLAGRPIFKDRDVYFPVLKPIGSGRFTNSDPFLDKTSLAPMTYSSVRGKNVAKLYVRLLNQNLDYLIFESGRKIGSNYKHKLYNKDGSVITTPFNKSGISHVPFKYYGIQVETLNKKNKQIRGTQLTKLAIINSYDGGVPTDVAIKYSYEEWVTLDETTKEKESEIYKLVKANMHLLNKMTTEGYFKLLDKFGITDTGSSYIIDDHEKLQALLQDELFRREIEDNMKDALVLDPVTKKFTIPFEATPKYKQIQSILFSYIDKLIVQPKLNGGPKVEVSSVLYEDIRVTEDGKLVSSALKFYEPVIKNGKVVEVGRMEVYLPNWFRKNLRGTKYERMSDEDLIKELNKSSILNGIGFRIPTQEMNSIDSFVVKGFLPEEAGDTIVVPAELTAKAGSDFDIDKLNTYLKNVFINEKGEIAEVPYFNSLKEARDYVEKLTILKILDLSDIGKGPTLDELEDGELEDDTKDTDLAERLYIQGIENEYFKTLDKIILHPSNLIRLISPNSSDKMMKIRDTLFTLLGEKEAGIKTPSILNPLYMSKRRNDFLAGKGGVGIGAVGQTNNAISQLSSIVIDRSLLKNISDQSRHLLAPDGELVIRIPHNTTQRRRKDGVIDTYPTFSKRNNVDNDLISDAISQYINGYVDVGKDTFIIDVGANINVAGAYIIMQRLGISTENVVYFMNQPIIREYLKLLSKNGETWITGYSPFSTNKYDLYVNAAFSKFQTNQKFTEKQFNFDKFKSNIQRYYVNNDEFTEEEKAEQIEILKEFLKFVELSNQMRDYIQGTNYDTANISNSLILHKKLYQENTAKNKTVFTSAEAYMMRTHVGKIRDYVISAHKALADTLFKIEKREIFSKLSEIFNIFLDRRMREDDYLKSATKVIHEYFTYTLYSKDQRFNEIKKYMIDKETAVAHQLINLKLKGDIKDNAVLQVLKVREDKGKEGSIKNISLAVKAEGIFKANLYTDALRELRDNPHTKSFYEDLLVLAIMQSGFSNSPISFVGLIPIEDFFKLVSPMIPELENVQNVENFVNSGSFFRNNWHDNTIVPLEKNKGSIITFGGQVISKQFDLIDGIPPMWYRNELERQGIKQHLPMLKVWEGKSTAKSPYVKIRTVANDPETGVPYTKAQIQKMRKEGNYDWLLVTLYKRVDDKNGNPLKINYPKRSSSWVAYVPVNAYGDGFRLQEHHFTHRKSKVDNGTFKVDKEIDTVAVAEAFYNSLATPTVPTTSTVPSAPITPTPTPSIKSKDKIEQEKKVEEMKKQMLNQLKQGELPFQYGPNDLPKLNDENQNSCK